MRTVILFLLFCSGCANVTVRQGYTVNGDIPSDKLTYEFKWEIEKKF